MTRSLPSCIVIGSRKGGTRALLDMLSIHSRVRPAKAEVHFFDSDDNYKRGYEWYKEQVGWVTALLQGFYRTCGIRYREDTIVNFTKCNCS